MAKSTAKEQQDKAHRTTIYWSPEDEGLRQALRRYIFEHEGETITSVIKDGLRKLLNYKD